ncbi:MAG: hypothetical protein QX198_03765 [Methylococcaceae bacterium]
MIQQQGMANSGAPLFAEYSLFYEVSIMLLEIGETKKITVSARQFWNDSGIDVEEKGIYSFAASGKWLDFYIFTNPNGYPGYLYQKKLATGLRQPNANWFALCGNIDKKNSSNFLIGSSCRYRADSTGRLFCYANDLPSWYWNNFFCVEVSVTRIE